MGEMLDVCSVNSERVGTGSSSGTKTIGTSPMFVHGESPWTNIFTFLSEAGLLTETVHANHNHTMYCLPLSSKVSPLKLPQLFATSCPPTGQFVLLL